MKRGFGLIEVLVAAVVLGFLFIGLNALQKGNRESILRVRARDVANVIAQDVIDSMSALGSASVAVGEINLHRTHIFTGSVNAKVPYSIKVVVMDEDPDLLQVVNDETDFMKAQGAGIGNNELSVRHRLSKQVDVTVNWEFKRSLQSINVSAIVR